MEKGLKRLLFLFIVLSLSIIVSNKAYSYDCINGYSDTECVCGYVPDSSSGYGQVIIGSTVYSCNNIADGVCPEDFTDGSSTANCSSCADADCSSGGTTIVSIDAGTSTITTTEGTDVVTGPVTITNTGGTTTITTPGGNTIITISGGTTVITTSSGSNVVTGPVTVSNTGGTATTNTQGYVYGYVRDKNGVPISQATVTGNPNQWDPNANLKITATTNAAGYYISSDFITGTYYFSASKDGYDTELKEATVSRDTNTQIDFTLQDGTCYSDCTNSQNRCSAACDGVTFADGSSCNFYNGPLAAANEVKLLCNNREKGTKMKLTTGATATEAYFVDCCEGTPEPFYYTKADVKPPSDCQNVITQEKIARYNDVAVRVITKYCGD